MFFPWFPSIRVYMNVAQMGCIVKDYKIDFSPELERSADVSKRRKPKAARAVSDLIMVLDFGSSRLFNKACPGCPFELPG
jgi:hypothetical protein